MFSIIMIFLGGYLLWPLITGTKATDQDDDDLEEWLKKNPHHFWLNFISSLDNDDIGVPLAVINFVGALVLVIATPFIALFAAFGDQAKFLHNPAWLVAYLAGMATFGAISLTNHLVKGDWSQVWTLLKKAGLGLGHKLASWLPGIKKIFFFQTDPQDKIDLEVAQIHLRDIESLFATKKEQKHLKSLMARLHKVVKKDLPYLIKLRAAVRKRAAEARATIERQKDNGIIEGEEPMMEKSRNIYYQLLEQEKKQQHKIELVLTMLDHISTNISQVLQEIDQGNDLLIFDQLNQINNQMDQVLNDAPDIKELNDFNLRLEKATTAPTQSAAKAMPKVTA